MTNRLQDAEPQPCIRVEDLPPLPAIDWSAIGHEAPVNVDLGSRDKSAPLPKSDIVVITWTSAEWSALDHVFANSGEERHRTSTEFRKGWHWRANDQYIEGAHCLWGFYRMVKVKSVGGVEYDVLLFKSSSHLAHPPYCDGLMKMVEMIIEEAQPQRLYTIGTAGGAAPTEKLGDTVVTNAGTIMIHKSENEGCNLNGVSVQGDWFPNMDLVTAVEDKLLFKLSSIVNEAELNYMLCQTINDPDKGNPAWAGTVTVKDLINEAIDPTALEHPKGLNKKDIPLLTTDFYYIAQPDDAGKYSVLEMDDAIIGLVAQRHHTPTPFIFVRNISDPIVPFNTKDGKPIDPKLREGWSGQVYENFGLYTSMNGALVTWATIAGDPATSK